jgi:hypothetical protein
MPHHPNRATVVLQWRPNDRAELAKWIADR